MARTLNLSSAEGICVACGMPSADPYLHRERYAHDPEFVDQHGDLYRFDTESGRSVLREREYRQAAAK